MTCTSTLPGSSGTARTGRSASRGPSTTTPACRDLDHHGRRGARSTCSTMASPGQGNVLAITEEDYLKPGCDGQGSIQTWKLTASSTDGTIKLALHMWTTELNELSSSPVARPRPGTARPTGSTSRAGCSHRAGTTRACASSTSPTRATSSRSPTTRPRARSGRPTSRPTTRRTGRSTGSTHLGDRRALRRPVLVGRRGPRSGDARGRAALEGRLTLGLRLPAPALSRAVASSPPRR